MAIGTEIAPADPAPRGTVRVRAEVRRGVDLAAAPPRRHEARRRSCGGLRAGIGGVRTGVAVRLGGEGRTGGGLMLALWQWGWGLRCRRVRGGVAGPCPLEHKAQPHQGNQHQLVEKEIGYHGKTPSYKCWVVLENSNVAKLASTQYLAVHPLPQEDCYDTDDASTRELYAILVPDSTLCTVQSPRHREYRASLLDRQAQAHRTAALHGMRPGVLRTGGDSDGPEQTVGRHRGAAAEGSAVGCL